MMKFFLTALFTFSTLTVMAVDLPLRINAGGPAIGKAGDSDYWADGKTYVSGGRNYKFKGSHDVSKVNNPGPDKIYETVRHQDHRYEIKGLPAGEYQFRFHLTEGVKTNSRAMDYRINGELVINNLNVLKAAGGLKKAYIVDVPFKLSKSGVVTIEAHRDKGSDVFEAGLEIILKKAGAPVKTMSRKAPVVETPITSAKPVSDSKLRKVTGGPARFVWLQGNSWMSYTKSSSNVSLMGMDTEDGLGERKIIPNDAAYSKPLFTPSGQQIVFSDMKKRKVFVVDWNGENLRELGSGLASDVWRDPKTNTDWVYVRIGNGTKSSIVRRELKNPKRDETVWKRTENGHSGVPWFQLSGDGAMFSDAFPWPNCGAGDLEKESWKKYDRGCWPGISPDDSHRAFVFSGSHAEVSMFDRGGTRQRKIAVNTMPEIRGKKVYFPRWSNDPRFITVTGPERDSKAELYLGKFDADFRKIESWARVTNNSRTELFGDAWFGNAPIAKARTLVAAPVEKTKPVVAGKSEPVWIWESAKAQNEAQDVICGGDLHGLARFGRFSELLLDRGWFTANADASGRIAGAAQAANGITIEASIRSFSTDQKGPARIISLSKNSSERNFTVGQEGEYFVLRIRTRPDDGNGLKKETRLGKVEAGTLQHLLVSHSGSTLQCFLDGKMVTEVKNFPVDYSSWNKSYGLILGDENGGGRDWRGQLEGIQISGGGISESAANSRFAIEKKRTGNRSPLMHVVVSAKLLEATKTPTREEMDSYQRALVENVYEVQNVISGKIPEMEKDKVIIVRQWAVMDGKELPLTKKRKLGFITELSLEPIEGHPELEGEFRSGDHERFGPPVLFDVNSHTR